MKGKAEIIEIVSGKTLLNRDDVASILDAFTTAVTKGVCDGQTVNFRGFGRFHIDNDLPEFIASKDFYKLLWNPYL